MGVCDKLGRVHIILELSRLVGKVTHCGVHFLSRKALLKHPLKPDSSLMCPCYSGCSFQYFSKAVLSVFRAAAQWWMLHLQLNLCSKLSTCPDLCCTLKWKPQGLFRTFHLLFHLHSVQFAVPLLCDTQYSACICIELHSRAAMPSVWLCWSWLHSHYC